MTAVVVMPKEKRAFAKLLPKAERTIEGPGRIYLFYTVDDAALRSNSYFDLGGELLLRSRAFQTPGDAEAWVKNELRGAD